MLLNKRDRDAIAAGRISLAFRRWRRPTVKAGGSLRTAAGVLAIDAVDRISLNDVSEADARQAGYESRSDLLKALATREGELYRVRLRLAGPDPRIRLRAETKLCDGDIGAIRAKLARYDAASRHGAWTMKVLRLIGRRPEARAADLAAATGFEKDWLKTNIRKLKELGLTESLDVGYRLSPRGRSFLEK